MMSLTSYDLGLASQRFAGETPLILTGDFNATPDSGSVFVQVQNGLCIYGG